MTNTNTAVSDITEQIRRLRAQARETIEYLRTIDPEQARFLEAVEREKLRLFGVPR